MGEKPTNLFSIVERLQSQRRERQERDLQEFKVFLGSVIDEVFTPLREKPSVRYVGENKVADDTLMIVRDDIQQKLEHAFMRTTQSTLMRDRISNVLGLFPQYFGKNYQFTNKEVVVERLREIMQQRLDQRYPDTQGGSVHKMTE